MTVEAQQFMDRVEADIDEIEIWLRDRLRNKRSYDRLKSIHVSPTESHVCGWRASVRVTSRMSSRTNAEPSSSSCSVTSPSSSDQSGTSQTGSRASPLQSPDPLPPSGG